MLDVFDCPETPAPPETRAKSSLAGLGRTCLQERLSLPGIATKQQNMRCQQLWRWMYHHGVRDFDSMSNIGKAVKQILSSQYSLERPDIAAEYCSQDGTRKWLIRFDAGAEAETVFIPDVGRSAALCVSSQIGCSLNCRFCHTGTQKMVRNLSAQEIVVQLMIARDSLMQWPSGKADSMPSNIVFMGMGEPLYNLDAVIQAINTFSDGDGLAIGQRHITVSTAGVAPKIRELGERCRAMLAISLHAADNGLRDQLVPINRKYDLQTLFDAVRSWPGLANSRRVTFEYVMLSGVNDSDAQARDLLRLISGIPAKVNLIPFNSWPGAPYQCPTPERISEFANIIWRGGYASPVRAPRGQDILAACGQLRSTSMRTTRLSVEQG